ncbi:MAG: glycosyltransferase [Chitinophagaceae bacterium]|nr:MAG: glycosyltransferase [Chitinophagaceae bacterium]
MHQKRLAVVTTHPIQYYAPVFQHLAKQDLTLRVFYTWGKESVQKYDPDFHRVIEWDVPLLEGYDFVFLRNTSTRPGTHHFKGIINPSAVQAIEQFRPDAILVYGWSWHSHLKILRHFSGKLPVWFRGDSTLLDPQPHLKKLIRKVLLTWVYRHIDLAFYVGSHNKRYFSAFGLKEKQLFFSPHSIDNVRFANSMPAKAKDYRNKWGLSDSSILILFAGKLEPKKDPMALLQAFEELENPHVFLVFVGNGILENTLKEKARQSAKSRQIFFLDFQNQLSMPAIYQNCDLYCLPSVGPGETWGLAVNEAMASGKAVLVSDKVGCAPDLVEVGVNGEVFRAGDRQNLLEKLTMLTKNRQGLERMGEASAKLIQKWSFQEQINSILAHVNQLA